MSKDADLVASTAKALERLRLKAFVAHRDIPAGQEWLPYIQKALDSADAVAAFLAEGFRESEWTDQEVGYALGRGKRVVPVRLSPAQIPHGFLNPMQSPNVGGASGEEIAELIVDVLCSSPRERSRLLGLSIESIESDRELLPLQSSASRVERFRDDLDDRQLERLRRALRTNTVVRHDRNLRETLERTISTRGSDEGQR